MPPAFGTGQAEFRAGGVRRRFPVHRQTPDAPLRPVRSSTGDPAAAHEPPQMPNSSRLSGSNLPQTSRPAAVALQGRRPPRRRPTATPVVRVAQVWDSRHDRSVRPAASLPVWPVAALQHCSHRHPMAARVARAVTRTGCPARPAHSWAPVTSPTLCRPSNPGSSEQRSHTRSQIPRA